MRVRFQLLGVTCILLSLLKLVTSAQQPAAKPAAVDFYKYQGLDQKLTGVEPATPVKVLLA